MKGHISKRFFQKLLRDLHVILALIGNVNKNSRKNSLY